MSTHLRKAADAQTASILIQGGSAPILIQGGSGSLDTGRSSLCEYDEEGMSGTSSRGYSTSAIGDSVSIGVGRCRTITCLQSFSHLSVKCQSTFNLFSVNFKLTLSQSSVNCHSTFRQV